MRGRTYQLLAVSILALAASSTASLTVTNGFLDNTHRSVGWTVGILAGRNDCDNTGQAILCSGVLIAPDVFLTTGYCAYHFHEGLDNGSISRAYVVLDASPNIPGTVVADCSKFVAVSSVHVNPVWEANPFDGNVGVFLLSSPQTIQPAQMPKENRFKGSVTHGPTPHFTLVSMGGTDLPTGTGVNFTQLHRRWAYADIPRGTVFVDVDSATAVLEPGGLNGKTACLRDVNQGGGVFIGGTNELIGVIDAGSPCVTRGSFQRVDTSTVRPFLEQFVTLP